MASFPRTVGYPSVDFDSRVTYISVSGAISVGKSTTLLQAKKRLERKGFGVVAVLEPLEKMKKHLCRFYSGVDAQSREQKLAQQRAVKSRALADAVKREFQDSPRQEALMNNLLAFLVDDDMETAMGKDVDTPQAYFDFEFQCAVNAWQLEDHIRARQKAATLIRHGAPKVIVLQERCALDSLLVFFQKSVDDGRATKAQADTMATFAVAPNWRPHGIAVVHTPVEQSLERQKERKRRSGAGGEEDIDDSYLRDIHRRYHDVFYVHARNRADVLRATPDGHDSDASGVSDGSEESKHEGSFRGLSTPTKGLGAWVDDVEVHLVPNNGTDGAAHASECLAQFAERIAMLQHAEHRT